MILTITEKNFKIETLLNSLNCLDRMLDRELLKDKPNKLYIKCLDKQVIKLETQINEIESN